MALTVYKEETRQSLTRFTRPAPATYRDENGVEQTAPANTMRINYDENGKMLGIKFGDGDTMRIPSITNTAWVDEDFGGVFMVFGQAPNGVTWWKCGDVEIQGVMGFKLHIIELTKAQVENLSDYIDVFPNADEIEGECHMRITKYYNETITLPEERDMMDELNVFMNGDWY